MNISETLKQKIDELEIERHVTEAIAEAETAVLAAVARAGGVVHERRAEIDGWLQWATEAVNERTEGRYAEHVDTVRGQLAAGVEKIAEQRTEPPTD